MDWKKKDCHKASAKERNIETDWK